MSIRVIREPANAKVDIVFVHGLHGDQAPWTSEANVFWPEKLLPAKVSDARILSFEYQAAISSFFDEDDGITDISNDLINELMDHRTETEKVAPSRSPTALVRVADHPRKRDLIGCVHGILLLGTPHFQAGSLAAATKYFQLAQEQIQSEPGLKDRLQRLIAIPLAFANLKEAGADFEIEGFYAGAGTKLDGKDAKIVDEGLARSPGAPPPERLARNQLRLSQYDTEDEKDFKKVLRVLTQWASKIVVPEKDKGAQNVANTTFSGSNNSGLQLGQNVGTLKGFSFGRSMDTQVEIDAGQASDLAQLWQSAVEDYEQRTKKSLRLVQFSNVNQIMKGTEGLSDEFEEFRHDRSKTDNVRTAFKNNLWLIQKVVDTVQVVGTAASAFPPAMPASLIFTAFGQVMQTFATVSADYDKIMGFFDFTHRFFDRLSMIEDKTPQQKPFQRCVARVFSGMLIICSVAQEYAEKKRFKKWFRSLIDGSDEALSGAIKDMEGAVNELNQAVGLVTLRTVEILDDVVQSMNGKVEFLVAKVTLIDGRMEAIKSDTGTIIQQGRELGSKQDAMMDMLNEQSRLFNDAVKSFDYIQMGANFGKSFQTSLLKLDVVRLRLTRWGQSVGLAKMDDVKSLQMTKLTPKDREEVQGFLDQILELFADAEAASKRFRTRNAAVPVLDPAKELDSVSASLHQKMEDLAKKRQGKSELEQDEWTMYHEKNFTRLIEDISVLVDGLVDLFPGIQEEQRKFCEEEVSEMNTNEDILPLLKDVAAGYDKLLSDAVVKVIQSTTTYTNSVVFSGPNSGFQVGNNSGKISGVRFSSS
ncbi:hypothetical protein CNMCM7691_006841 [Aspergillus felis]|uniref:Uncharacterized protein n=1 Tax=Aspergillus felis TaxID=1287682 RepID=A0A8H6V7N8_9EURO|nr:hypothetical protein CNMCM7691_006841 [Aspergillus felis]